jgi:hypothetical protein
MSAVTFLLDPRIHARKARLRKLLALRFQVDAEIATLQTELFGHRKAYGPRDQEVDHGTERGYQWHRHQYRKHGAPWPLPADDPCGCKAAHRAHYYATNQAEKRRDQRRRAAEREAS